MTSQGKRFFTFVAGLTLLLGAPALGADTQKNPNPSPEMRQKMAEVHQRIGGLLEFGQADGRMQS